MAEHEVSNLGVEGSTPFSRSSITEYGEVTELGNVADWKSVAYLMVAWVQIPLSPPTMAIP